MNKLFEEKTYKEIDYSDLDDFISNYYGHPNKFECVCSEEWGNYQSHTIRVEKKKLSDYDQSYIDFFKKFGKYKTYSLRAMLTDMCNNGVFPEGEYLVKIFW